MPLKFNQFFNIKKILFLEKSTPLSSNCSRHKSRLLLLRPPRITEECVKYELFTSKFHDCVTLEFQFSVIRDMKLLVFVGLFALFTSTRGSLDWRTTWQDLSALESTRWQVIDCEFFCVILFYFVSDANNKGILCELAEHGGNCWQTFVLCSKMHIKCL